MHIAFLPLTVGEGIRAQKAKAKGNACCLFSFSPSPRGKGWGEGIKPHQANAKGNARSFLIFFSLSRGRGLG